MTLKIAQLGTFDVENYGDLLFPLIAKRRLTEKFPALEMTFVSPAGGPSPWSDCLPSIAYDHFASRITEYDLILIGGGSIIRSNKTDLATYGGGLTPHLAYSNLWAGVVEDNISQVPIVWNAPGIAAPFAKELRHESQQVLAATTYLSVRDHLSARFIETITDVPVHVVPDTAWDIGKQWSSRELDATYNATMGSTTDDDRPTIAVHVNRRYLRQMSLAELASALDAFSERMAARLILIAIGPCHNDDAIARELRAMMKSLPIIIDRPASLLTVAAAISRSAQYIGSSLHGFITAAAFGIPARIVAAHSMSKFPELLSSIGQPNLLHEDWNSALDAATKVDAVLETRQFAEITSRLTTELDGHWNRIFNIIDTRLDITKSYSPPAFRSKLLELAGDKNDADHLRKRLDSATHQISFLTGLIDGERREREKAHLAATKSNDEFARAKAEFSRLEDLAESYRQRAKKLEEEQSRQRRRAERAEAAVADLMTSTSWRVTQPLRSASLFTSTAAYVARRLPNRMYNLLTAPYISIRHRLRRPQTLTKTRPEDINSAIQFMAEKEKVDIPGVNPGYAVVIAVYNAAEDVEKCLISVRRHAVSGLRVIVVDDCSPDPAVANLLARFADIPGWTILTNPVNIGYTRSINVGLREAGQDDAIILNSDTIVTPHWSQRLHYAAYRSPEIATVTPVSNNAGAFSVPIAGKSNERPASLTLDSYARAISHEMADATVQTPTGNGFCMYMKRATIEQVGYFDEDAFPKGYGEENDWCMRARAAGWVHLIDFTTYIYHKRSASFGEAKTELMTHGRKIVDNRYPDYKQAVAALSKNALSAAYRQRIAAIEPSAKRYKPRLLFVLSTVTGGTPQTNLDLMREVSWKYECFVLRSDSKKVEIWRLVCGETSQVETITLKKPLDPFPHRSLEYDELVRGILNRYAIELLHIRHIGWHSLGLIDVARRGGTSVIFSFHDFYTICPSIKLLDEKWVYCGGKCTSTPGECAVELWDKARIPNLKNENVYAWRQAMSDALGQCDEFITTSPFAKSTLIENFSWLKNRPFHVIPHGRNIVSVDLMTAPPTPGERLRVLVLGNINEAKGNLVYRDVADRYRDWDVEFHVLGNWRGKRIETSNFIYHGEYSRDDLATYLAKIKPHCGAVLSIWPETYCHTLTECWSFGIPVFVFDIGAVGERVREAGGGWLIQHFDADSLFNAIEGARNDEGGWTDRLKAIDRWRGHPELNTSCATMAAQYEEVYARYVVSGEA